MMATQPGKPEILIFVKNLNKTFNFENWHQNPGQNLETETSIAFNWYIIIYI